MILELSGYLNYNYHCDNVLWLWSVLLEDQNKISFKPGVLGFRSTLLSSSSSGGLRARSQLFTSHIQHPGPEGCMLALGLTCILSKVSLSDNLFISTLQSPWIPWSLQDGASTSRFTPLCLWFFLTPLTTTWRRFSPSRSCLVLTLIVLYFPFYVHFKLYLFTFYQISQAYTIQRTLH